MIAENLPVTYEINESPVYQRGFLGDALVRRMAARDNYDFIVPLDADEFIAAGSRETLESELAAVPAVGAMVVGWLNYVPTSNDDVADRNPVTRIRHRLSRPHATQSKVFFASRMLDFDDVYLGDGNHDLLSRIGREIRPYRSRRVFLAHFPIRSSEQLVSKVALGTVARSLSPDLTALQSRHWRALLRDPSVTSNMPLAELSRHAIGYLGGEDATLVEAPLATSARVLRHQDLIHVDSFTRLSGLMSAITKQLELMSDVKLALTEAKTTRHDALEQQRMLAEVDVAHQKVQRLHQKLRKYRWIATAAIAMLVVRPYRSELCAADILSK